MSCPAIPASGNVQMVETVQAATVRSYPRDAGTVLMDRTNVSLAQPFGVAWVTPPSAESHVLRREPIDPCSFDAYPQITLPIAVNG